jgi:hypothetical protein
MRIARKALAVGASVVKAARTTKAISEPMMTRRRPNRSEIGPHTNVSTP